MFPDAFDSPVGISHEELPVKLGLVIEDHHDARPKSTYSSWSGDGRGGEAAAGETDNTMSFYVLAGSRS